MADALGAPIKAVIFDFDGTLSNSGDWFLTVVDHLAERYNFRRVSDDEVERLRHRPTREVIDYLGIPRWKLPFIANYTRKLVGRNVDKIELFPGIDELLARVAEAGVRMALVTSNAEANARAILGPGNAARFEMFAAGSSLFGKAPKFRKVLKAMGLSAAETLSVGDETRDIDAAQEVGMRSGAVLWGYAAEDALAAVGPDVLFHTQDALLEYLAARRRDTLAEMYRQPHGRRVAAGPRHPMPLPRSDHHMITGP